jgi:hypothetical protein
MAKSSTVSAMESLEPLRETVEQSLRQTAVFELHSYLKACRMPSKTTNVQGDQAPAKGQKMLKTFHELANTIGISYGVCQGMLTENLNMRRIAVELTNDQSL